MRVSVRVEGVDKVRGFLRRAAQNLHGQPNIVEIGFTHPDRNALIAGVQAAHGRDPFFLTPADAHAHVTVPMQVALHNALAHGWSGWRAALRAIGLEIIIAYQRHINLGLSGQRGAVVTGGATRTRALTPKYAAWKRKRFGAKPILRATDELYGSMRVRLTRGRF